MESERKRKESKGREGKVVGWGCGRGAKEEMGGKGREAGGECRCEGE
jgi:hypothetical protein